MKKLFAFISAIILLTLSFNFGGREAFAYEEVRGEFKNVAIAVEFSDTTEEDGMTEARLSALNSVFNGEEGSLKSFMGYNSQNKLEITTEFTRVVRIDAKSAYFMPRYEERGDSYIETNPDGYDNRKYTESGEVSLNGSLTSAEYFFREHEFISLVLKELSDLTEIEGADRDGDGYIDGLTIVPCESVKVDLTDRKDWGELFWPHMTTRFYGEAKDVSSYYYVGDKEFVFENVPFAKKTVYKYVIAPFDSICHGGDKGLTVLCHEFMHVLGAPDYYSYDGSEDYVGEFDLMGTAETPTLSLTYLRERMGWIGDGEVSAVEESGEYFLKPTEESGEGEVKAYKIVLSDYLETNDCYYIECRKLGGSDEGIIIYRVNEKNGFITQSNAYGYEELGNIYGDPEVYVFRRQSPSQDMKKNAFLFDGFFPSDRKFGSESGNKNLITTSGGENTKISVEVTGESGGGYYFRVNIPETPEGDISSGVNLEIKADLKGNEYVEFKNAYRKGYAYILVTKENIEGASAEDIISGKYGAAAKIPVSFQKYRLPKADGTMHVCVCLSDGEKTSEAYEKNYGQSPVVISQDVVLIGGGIGLAAFLVVLLAVLFFKKR